MESNLQEIAKQIYDLAQPRDFDWLTLAVAFVSIIASIVLAVFNYKIMNRQTRISIFPKKIKLYHQFYKCYALLSYGSNADQECDIQNGEFDNEMLFHMIVDAKFPIIINEETDGNPAKYNQKFHEFFKKVKLYYPKLNKKRLKNIENFFKNIHNLRAKVSDSLKNDLYINDSNESENLTIDDLDVNDSNESENLTIDDLDVNDSNESKNLTIDDLDVDDFEKELNEIKENLIELSKVINKMEKYLKL